MAITKSYTFTNNTTIDPEEMNQNFDDVLDEIKGAHHRDVDGTLIAPADIHADWGLVPKGGIMMWNGLISTIPSGYAFCNGAGGTIDHRNRFALCSGQDAGGTYDTADTGGAETINIAHSHTVNAHNHGIAGSGTHQHYADWYTYNDPSASDYDDTFDDGDGSGVSPAGSNHRHHIQDWVQANGEHNHGASTSGGTTTPGTNSQLSATQSVMNPFRATVFIQKV